MTVEPVHPPDTESEGPAVVDAVAHGDADALAQLYDQHAGLAFALCCLILRNTADAEEAVADTFLQVWRTADRFDPDRGSTSAWITTMARSRAIDIVRRRARRDRYVDDTADPTTVSGPQARTDHLRVLPDADQVDARRLAVWALEQLPVPQRQAIELSYLDGFTHSEISARLGEPIGTIKTRIRDGMKKLRTTLSPPQETIGP